MIVTAGILILLTIFIFITQKEPRWIRYGNLTKSGYTTINQHKYYIEEVVFKQYNEALTMHYKVIDDVASYGEALEVKYDLYDWTYSIYRFTDSTIAIKHLRRFNMVRLIKSKTPISIEEFEKDNPGIK